MTAIRVTDVLKQRAAVSRESVHRLIASLPDHVAEILEIDFSGVEAVSPSFVDELLGVLSSTRWGDGAVRLESLPSRMVNKLHSMAPAYGITIAELDSSVELRFPDVAGV